MAVHHDKLMKFLRTYSDPHELVKDKKCDWEQMGDLDTIANTFRMLADEITAGTFD